MTQPTFPPIQKQIVVEAPIERAFRVFTAHMATWWPPSFHIGKAPFVECVVEPRAGGRWFERAADGAECTWGKVLLWDPPARLVLAWQLNGQFAYDPELITEVDVRFTALSTTSTRVDLEHRHLERMGELAAKAVPQLDGGWGGILQSYGSAANG